MDDFAGLAAIIIAIRHMHKCEPTWLKSVPVLETVQGQTVWEGEVQVFQVHHPRASKIYAWSQAYGTLKKRRRFYAVLGVPPITSAAMAVRASIVRDNSKN